MKGTPNGWYLLKRVNRPCLAFLGLIILFFQWPHYPTAAAHTNGRRWRISAATKFHCWSTWTSMSSPSVLILPKNLDRIGPRYRTSDIKLAGYLEFYKTAIDEGVRGGITLKWNWALRLASISMQTLVVGQPGSNGIQHLRMVFLFLCGRNSSTFRASPCFRGFHLWTWRRISIIWHAHDHRLAQRLICDGNFWAQDRLRVFGMNPILIQISASNLRSSRVQMTTEKPITSMQLLQNLFQIRVNVTGFERIVQVMTDGISVSTIGRAGNSPVADM